MEFKFKQVHTAKDLTISAITLAVGIGLCFVNTGLGFLLVASGILLLILYKSGYKREGNDILLQKKVVDVARHCSPSIRAFLNGNETDPEISAATNEGIARLEVYYNADAPVAYAQLFDYNNYNYEPSTELAELKDARAEKLISKLK
ncbi:MAG: hypothetical protein J6Y83_00185 [Bacteroidales bacterium]|nr:hypothetical protein [Bacteroidales bacterium]MBO7487723.1 hypothetical protein [Bacteroidales bacterium]MBP5316100.1 hypothetical protein [Bacteroidales bacterium]